MRCFPIIIRRKNSDSARWRGLRGGTATDPEKEYNIEFLSPRHSLSQQLEGILAQYEFNPHRAVRKGANTVYVKSSDHLEDLLTFILGMAFWLSGIFYLIGEFVFFK